MDRKGPVKVKGTKELTIVERKKVIDMIASLRESLKLDHWDIRVETTCVEDAYATISHWPSQNRATLTIGCEFFNQTLEDQWQTLVHELVHCHAFLLHEQVSNLLEENLSTSAAKMANSVVTVEVERLVDALATVFVETALAP